MSDSPPGNSNMVSRYMEMILKVGVPSAVMMYLVYVMSQGLIANQVVIVQQQHDIQKSLMDHVAATEGLLAELRRANLIALQACSQAAKNEAGIRSCWAAAGAAAK